MEIVPSGQMTRGGQVPVGARASSRIFSVVLRGATSSTYALQRRDNTTDEGQRVVGVLAHEATDGNNLQILDVALLTVMPAAVAATAATSSTPRATTKVRICSGAAAAAPADPAKDEPPPPKERPSVGAKFHPRWILLPTQNKIRAVLARTTTVLPPSTSLSSSLS